MRDQKITVVVVDDQALYREGLKSFLRLDDGVVLVGEAADGEEAMRVIDETSPDVVLLDVRMRGTSGIEVCERVVAAHPGTRVLMLSSSDADEDLFASIRAGAAGYLLKESESDEVADAIRRVAAGGSFIHPSVAGSLLAEFVALSRPTGETPWAALSERELEVLRHIAAGLRNREIGQRLFISEFTVKNHVRSILDKLRLTSRVEAAAWAIRSGLAPEEPVGNNPR